MCVYDDFEVDETSEIPDHESQGVVIWHGARMETNSKAEERGWVVRCVGGAWGHGRGV